MRKTAVALTVLAAAVLLIAAPACKKSKSGETAEEAEEAKLEAELAAEAAAAEAAAKPVPPPSRMSEDVYVEIRARTALIFEKYKDDLPLAEQTVFELYEKLGVSQQEFKVWEAKQAIEKRAALEKKVVEFMQKILSEYR